MNQKGEVTLLSCLILFALMVTILLCMLELQKSFMHLKDRTHLFLCVKESKIVHHDFMKIMGQTNWGIKNLSRVALIIMFIPGLQGAAVNSQKTKKYLQYIQNITLVDYFKKLVSLKAKSCPLDPRMLATPFKLGGNVFRRDVHGAVELREKKWTYYFYLKPYSISLKVDASHLEAIRPNINYTGEEKGAMLSFHLSSL